MQWIEFPQLTATTSAITDRDQKSTRQLRIIQATRVGVPKRRVVGHTRRRNPGDPERVASPPANRHPGFARDSTSIAIASALQNDRGASSAIPPCPRRVIPKWYHTQMALTVRTDPALEEALTSLSETEGASRQEIIRRAVLDRYERSGHSSRVVESTNRMVERWGDVLERLGSE